MDAAAIAARCLPRHVHLLSRAYEGCALLNSSRFLLQVRRAARVLTALRYVLRHSRFRCGRGWVFMFWFALAHACVMTAHFCSCTHVIYVLKHVVQFSATLFM